MVVPQGGRRTGDQASAVQMQNDQGRFICRDCDAANFSSAKTCWLCGAERERFAFRPGYIGQTSTRLEPPPLVNPRSYSLSSLFLFVTLIAVSLGLFVQAPGLGIIVAVVALPAYVRTLCKIARQQNAGQTISTHRRVSEFLVSLGIVALVAASSVVAFCMVCVPLGVFAVLESLPPRQTSSGNGTLWYVAWTLGVIVGLTVGICALIKLWRRP